MKKHWLTIFVFFMVANAIGQVGNTPNDSYHKRLYERFRLLQGTDSTTIHSSFQPYSRMQAQEILDGLSDLSSPIDQFNLLFLKRDNWLANDSLPETRNPVLKYFYQSPQDFYQVNHPSFRLRLNPVVYFSGGVDGISDKPLYINTRGVEVNGSIDGKVGFYSYIGENQARFPVYVREFKDSTRVIPGEGFHKSFKEGGYDFFHVRGYIDFNATRHINVQFGRDRFQIGQGIRSVLLSDFASPYLFLKVQTRVWKINYTNLFTQLTEDIKLVGGSLKGTGSYPDKFLSLHHLSVNLGPKFNLGFFESVMYGSSDSTRATLQARYLNPVIFYRAVEHQDGSSGNVQLGMDAEWLPFKGVSFYGQFLLDEFLLEHVRARDGWWANKYGLLLGTKYLNAFSIPQLDINLEYSHVRPFTYSHHTSFGSYSHFRQNLAHPRGSNFREYIVDLNYQPLTRLTVHVRWILDQFGADNGAENWGSDPYIGNTTRIQDFDNKIGQGIESEVSHLSFNLHYMILHNLFFDISYINRSFSNELGEENKMNIIQSGIRFNIAERRHDF